VIVSFALGALAMWLLMEFVNAPELRESRGKLGSQR
jgi:hypothetical protein